MYPIDKISIHKSRANQDQTFFFLAKKKNLLIQNKDHARYVTLYTILLFWNHLCRGTKKTTSQNKGTTCVIRFFEKKSKGKKPATLLKKRLWHEYFPVNFKNTFFYRTPMVAASSITKKTLIHGVITPTFFQYNTVLHYAKCF